MRVKNKKYSYIRYPNTKIITYTIFVLSLLIGFFDDLFLKLKGGKK
jgi:hypothetical protein